MSGISVLSGLVLVYLVSHVLPASLLVSEFTGNQEDAIPVGFAPGIVQERCLYCICMTLTQCKPVGCHYVGRDEQCGYFQLTRDYWTDCGSLGKSWQSCSDDITCSSQCVQNYMKIYMAHVKCPFTCESFAREHVGGPKGCNNSATLGFWKKLNQETGCRYNSAGHDARTDLL